MSSRLASSIYSTSKRCFPWPLTPHLYWYSQFTRDTQAQARQRKSERTGRPVCSLLACLLGLCCLVCPCWVCSSTTNERTNERRNGVRSVTAMECTGIVPSDVFPWEIASMLAERRQAGEFRTTWVRPSLHTYIHTQVYLCTTYVHAYSRTCVLNSYNMCVRLNELWNYDDDYSRPVYYLIIKRPLSRVTGVWASTVILLS